VRWLRGEAALRAWLAEAGPDPRRLRGAELARWFRELIEPRRSDPLFALRLQARELAAERRAVRSRLARALRAARARWQLTPLREAFERDQGALAGLERAVAGLRAAVEQGDASAAKLRAFEERRAALRERLARIEAEHPVRREWRAALAAGEEEDRRSGLAELNERIAALRREAGSRQGSRGSAFEAASGAELDRVLVPELEARWGGPVWQLRGVTFGCARAELDHVFVAPGAKDEAARVLAVAEAKAGPDDLASGWGKREENLAWFAGRRAGYRPEEYRTERDPDGHFRGAVEAEGPEGPLRIDRTSFALFAGESWASGLYLTTQRRRLRGLSGAEVARLLDAWLERPELDPETPAGARALERWLKRQTADFQTPDLVAQLLREGGSDRLFLEERDPPREAGAQK
jgi:hypothetical protein